MTKLQSQGGAQRRPLVAVIGDAVVAPGSEKDRISEAIGRLLVDAGFRVLTGGLGGVMEAALRGARSSDRYSDGDTVAILPGHDPNEANPFADIVIASGLDHVRNSVVSHADALIAVGGGAGTMSEICMAWIYKRLIVALQLDGWSGRIADQPVDGRRRYPGLPDDRVYGARDADEAVRLIHDLIGQYNGQHRGVRRRDAL